MIGNAPHQFTHQTQHFRARFDTDARFRRYLLPEKTLQTAVFPMLTPRPLVPMLRVGTHGRTLRVVESSFLTKGVALIDQGLNWGDSLHSFFKAASAKM